MKKVLHEIDIQLTTPGPWEVRPSSNKGNGTDWRDIVSLGTPFSPSYVGEALVQDATLIASAPELLNACKQMIAVWGVGYDVSMQAKKKMEDAIALAEGRKV